MILPQQLRDRLSEALEQGGLRSTRQREEVFGLLMDSRDHPTADEVYVRAKKDMPTISLATVYNCLETLVTCGLVRQVNFEREPTRYCANLREHAHLFDTTTGKIEDIPLPASVIEQLKQLLPENVDFEELDITFQGRSHPTSRRSTAHPS